MSEKHFTLDIDPEGLRSAATKLGNLAETLGGQATKVTGTPGEIANRWTGTAATDIQHEMTALGAHLTSFQTAMAELPEALRSLATDYDDALERLPELNQKWEQAEQDYQDAVTAAGTALTQGREDATGDDGKVPEADASDLRRARDNAVSGAADTRQTTQHNLEVDFGYLKQWLGQQTRALGTALRDSGPLDVSDSQIEAWRSGEGPQLDRSPLFSSLILSRQRDIELVTPDVEEAVDALNDALDEGDQDAVNDALDAIAEHADDPVWSEALARALGPGGMQDLYLKIDDGLKNSDLYIEEIWPHLSGFNETVANGVSQLPDDDFADYLNEWMKEDYGPKMWALLASADAADGRINAAAMAHQSEIYNSSLSDGGLGMPGLFPQVFNYAYPDTDQMEQWADRSSGDDLARILENCSPEEIQEIMFRMHNVQTPGGTMNEDDYQLIADLWGETIQAMQDRFHAAQADGKSYDLAPLIEALKARNANAGQPPYDDMLDGLTEQIVNDPALMVQLLADAEDSRIKPSDLKDVIGDSGVKVKDIIESIINHQLSQGDDPEAVAANIGLLLRADDILGEDFKWDGVVKSVVKDALGALGKAAGPVLGVLDAVLSEIERIEELDQAWDSAAEKNAAQELLAFSLYVQAYGVPEGFDEFVVANNGSVPDHQLVNRFLDEMRRHPGADWEKMRLLITTIDETRDEQ
ncbi:WXG100 family type VII secretion target [Nocardioides sp. W7]|uniref:WXG100 family type VII secretion target n=1 Tax=Nocardioides sp. W7 TaxID=2931390 RepID=UPI001FD2EA48|nr:WXG100 family type VII secretion target [Nocardioides sp. W7]